MVLVYHVIYKCAGFEVLMVVLIKLAVCLGVTPCQFNSYQLCSLILYSNICISLARFRQLFGLNTVRAPQQF
jgi:hypothetical protein